MRIVVLHLRQFRLRLASRPFTHGLVTVTVLMKVLELSCYWRYMTSIKYIYIGHHCKKLSWSIRNEIREMS
jgi:hypothetical protein